MSTGELRGTVEHTSLPMESEAAARRWIRDGRQRYGLEDMPEPKIIQGSKS